MKKTNLLLTVLCLTGFTAPLAAQGTNKVLPAAARALAQKAPVRMSGTKRFTFPKQFPTLYGTRSMAQLNTALQRNLSQQEVSALPSQELPPLPTFAVLSQGLPEKLFLELTAKERAFYQQETTNAFNLLSSIKSLRLLQDQNITQDSLITEITTGIVRIKNDYLRNLALGLLEEGNLAALQDEIAQYYSLGMPPEDAALSYTMRHPYKRNLQTMRLLHNPFIANEFKEPVQAFVSATFMSLADRAAFKQAWLKLQDEYERILQGAANTPAIQAQIAYYEQTINSLYRFIQKNRRLPKWNTRSNTEQDLHNRVEYLMTVEKQYNYPPFDEYHQNLRTLVEEHAPNYLSKQETLQEFEKFVKITGRPYPRSMREKGNISWDEEQLFDNLMYWRTQDEIGMNKAIRDIQLRLSMPHDSFYE